VFISLAQGANQPDKEKAHKFTCPSCGATQEFEPKDNCLVCPYCGNKEDIPTSIETIKEHSYEKYLNSEHFQKIVLTENALEVTCSACNATVTFPPSEVAGECAFCGTKIVAQTKSANPMLAPESLLPFKITQSEATNSVKKWISNRWFAPNALKKFATQNTIGGVYLPFWTYDSYTTSYYKGERGEHYQVTENYTENGETKTRTITKTRWYSASGTISQWFDDVLIPATRSVEQSSLDRLSPWDLANLNAYNPAYLSGYKAQCYQINLQEGFEKAKSVMDTEIRSSVRKDIGGDEQRISTLTTSHSAITFKHILLPVYLASYWFNQKIYQVMVNARTGEVQGERPYSVVKIVLFILMILAIIAVLYYLFR